MRGPTLLLVCLVLLLADNSCISTVFCKLQEVLASTPFYIGAYFGDFRLLRYNPNSGRLKFDVLDNANCKFIKRTYSEVKGDTLYITLQLYPTAECPVPTAKDYYLTRDLESSLKSFVTDSRPSSTTDSRIFKSTCCCCGDNLAITTIYWGSGTYSVLTSSADQTLTVASGATTMLCRSSGLLLYTYPSATPVTGGSGSGKGPTGPDEHVGLTGQQGALGLDGPVGVPGQQGALGQAGGVTTCPFGPILMGTDNSGYSRRKRAAITSAPSDGTAGASGGAADAQYQSVNGPPGEYGSIGSAGASGESGPTGPSGAIGNSGSTGPKGTTGDSGIIGGGPEICYAGPKGQPGSSGASGAQGSKGEPGPSGASGLQGSKGQPGSTGASGVQGSKGEPGPSGASGLQGSKGQPGSTGASGVQGSKGEPGSSGVSGAQGSTGSQHPGGANGIAGPTGEAGTSGVKGSSFGGTSGILSPVVDLTAPLAIGKAYDNVQIVVDYGLERRSIVRVTGSTAKMARFAHSCGDSYTVFQYRLYNTYAISPDVGLVKVSALTLLHLKTNAYLVADVSNTGELQTHSGMSGLRFTPQSEFVLGQDNQPDYRFFVQYAVRLPDGRTVRTFCSLFFRNYCLWPAATCKLSLRPVQEGYNLTTSTLTDPDNASLLRFYERARNDARSFSIPAFTLNPVTLSYG